MDTSDGPALGERRWLAERSVGYLLAMAAPVLEVLFS